MITGTARLLTANAKLVDWNFQPTERAGLYPAHNTLVQDSDANAATDYRTTNIHIGTDDNTSYSEVSFAVSFTDFLFGNDEDLAGLEVLGHAAIVPLQGLNRGAVVLGNA